MSGFCPNHGPYDGNACPFPPPHGNIGGRPENPSPLDDEDIPTEPPGGYSKPTYDSGEEPTEIPGGKGRGGFLTEDEEPTEYGSGGYDDLDFTELEAPPTATLALLWVKEGRRRGRTYPIKHGAIVGRKEGDLILDDPKVSNTHAKFNMEEDDFVIWDFGSSNGTYVNGKKIRKATVLEENDLVKIGDTVFVVKLLEPRHKRKSSTTRKTAAKKPSTRNPAAKKDG
jgi:hypothetical protein